jgi:hypothetical protein
MTRAPLIVLALFPPPLQARLEALRRAHYPAERNRVPAHCTLFHAVPGMVADELVHELAALAARHAPPRARMERVIDLDGGTALAVDSPDLTALRDRISDRFHGMLTGGDAVRARFHVTVQNKVLPREARALQVELAGQWRSLETPIAALAAHRVIDGLWHSVTTVAFRGRVPVLATSGRFR